MLLQRREADGIVHDGQKAQDGFVEAQGVALEGVADGRYAHFIDRAYRVNDQAWGVFSLICIAALGLTLVFGGGGREKAMVLLLFVTAIAFTVRAAWQAGRKRRHKWDNYFDK